MQRPFKVFSRTATSPAHYTENLPCPITIGELPSWSNRTDHHIRTFRTHLGYTTQWLVGCTLRKSVTTPLGLGKPISSCLVRFYGHGECAISLCIGLSSSLHIFTMNEETIEIPIQNYAPGFRFSNFFPLRYGLLLEVVTQVAEEPRRLYFCIHQPVENPTRIAELDEEDRLIFASRDLPLLVSCNHRHIKVWTTVRTSPSSKYSSGSINISLSNSHTANELQSVIEFPVLQLRLVHLQALESQPATFEQSAGLVHNFQGVLILYLISCGNLNGFNIGISDSGTIDSVTQTFCLNGVYNALSILASRREMNRLDLLVEFSSGELALFIAEHRICQVVHPVAKTQEYKHCRLSSEGFRTLSVKLEGGGVCAFEPRRVCFISPLALRSLSTVMDFVEEASGNSHLAEYFQKVSSVLNDGIDAADEWDSFVQSTLGFYNPIAPSCNSNKTENANWTFLSERDLDFRYSSLRSVRGKPKKLRFKETRNQSIPERQNFHSTCLLNPLHLLYEDLKVNTLHTNDVARLAYFNMAIALSLNISTYVDYYHHENSQEMKHEQLSRPSCSKFGDPPCFLAYINAYMLRLPAPPFPKLVKREEYSFFSHQGPSSRTSLLDILYRHLFASNSEETSATTMDEQALSHMISSGLRKSDIESLPYSIALAIHDMLWRCRQNPNPQWSSKAFLMVGREDLIPESSSMNEVSADLSLLRIESLCAIGSENSNVRHLKIGKQNTLSDNNRNLVEDGCDMTDFLFKLRFFDDRRLDEARRILRSTSPMVLFPTREHGNSGETQSRDFDNKLISLLQKRLGSPVGRGALTLRTYRPADPTKPLTIPEINVTGQIVGQKFAKISLSNAEHLNLEWGQFHNGVASGLRLILTDSSSESDNARVLTRSWIVRHKPASSTANASHAGMLLALGLGGFLPALRNTDMYQYLLPRHDLTSIGLMIGLAAGFRGTMHEKVSKMLGVHIRAFNESSFSQAEFGVSVEVQTAAVLSIGLLYQGSKRLFVLEGLVKELVRCTCYGAGVDGRQGLSLAAGIAIGMVCLGCGETIASVWKGRLLERLVCLANGDAYQVLNNEANEENNTKELEAEHKSETGNIPSTSETEARLIQDSGYVSVDVVSPGALIALALIYLKTNNMDVVRRLRSAENFYELDRSRPDIVYLQVVTRSLILWDSIYPSMQWMTETLPPVLRTPVDKNPSFGIAESIKADSHNLFLDIDRQSVLNARAFGVSGLCVALALRYASSNDEKAITLISMASIEFEAALLNLDKDSEDLNWVYSTSLSSCCLALGILCAGSGNLKVLRLLRRLRKRTSGLRGHTKRYGRHMAMDMAIGFLFLGGGCLTFGNSNDCIAALLCAIYPRFPVDVSDNQFHLQAFRHLYALAVESRCVEARDIDTDSPCRVDLSISSGESTVALKAPCVVPPSNCAQNVSVACDRYWPKTVPLVFKENKRSIIYVKRRPGHLSLLADPKGSKGILARSLFSPSSTMNNTGVKLIQAFSADPEILAFARILCFDGKNNISGTALRFTQILCECLAVDRPEALHCYFDAKCSSTGFLRNDLGALNKGNLALTENYLKSSKEARDRLISADDLAFVCNTNHEPSINMSRLANSTSLAN